MRGTFFRDGYEAQTMDIVFDEERAIQVTLIASPDAAPDAAIAPPAPVSAPTQRQGTPSRRKKKETEKKEEKVDEDIYRRPGMGEKP